MKPRLDPPLTNREFNAWTRMLSGEGWYANGHSQTAKTILNNALYSRQRTVTPLIERALIWLFQ